MKKPKKVTRIKFRETSAPLKKGEIFWLRKGKGAPVQMRVLAVVARS